LRVDRPGVYVFDARGGRPLAPGQLADWFQGGALSASQLPPSGVVPPPRPERTGPGALVCDLVAEWSRQPREVFARRCEAGGAPISFRLGPWRAQRTADVSSQLPRHKMRADHLEPPPAPAGATARPVASRASLAKLRPLRGGQPPPAPGVADPSDGMRVVNQGRGRLLVTVHGTATVWIDRN